MVLRSRPALCRVPGRIQAALAQTLLSLSLSGVASTGLALAAAPSEAPKQAGAGSTPTMTPATVAPIPADMAALLAKSLAMPVEGVAPELLRNSFSDQRAGHPHEAIDIAATRGTKVYAVDDGKLVKLFSSIPGGLTMYQFDPTTRFAYYYAHLDRYADGLREGMSLRRCDLLGYVGSTGNALEAAPHLHFAVFRLGPEKQWWKGTALDPYPALASKPSSCPVKP